jgi:nitric-oxide synthase
MLFDTVQEVIDRRNIDCNNAQEIFRCCLDHLKIATNGGNIVPVITIFKQRTPENMGPKIFNSQLIRYAGYRQKDGSYIGDPINADFTEFVKKLGNVFFR